jgi:mannose-1-phosphate guanylyltransferase/mannose-6-phosphate isomerase
MSETSGPPIVPVILAGGSGTRLWPVSRSAFPKHLVELVGERSLLQATALRLLRLAPPQRLVTVAAAGQAVLVRRQLQALAPALLDHLLLEPVARNTAAAVALAALHVEASLAADAMLWVCPADHLIQDEAALMAAVGAGLPAAAAGRLVTFGITPSRAETGFGWIAVGAALPEAGAFAVERFVEKPPRAEAERLLAAGGHLWNSGMFLFRADAILAELEAHSPEILVATRRALDGAPGGGREPAAAAYGRIPSAPIDKAVMERSAKVAVVPCEPRWSDVGSWQALWELMPKDAHGNAASGDVLIEAGTGNLVRSEHRLVALAGVRDLAVIETADALLVADLAQAEALKALVGRLAAADRAEAEIHALEHRPWGRFIKLARGTSFEVREVTLDPLGALSPQHHDSHDKHWIILEGRARVRLGGSVREHDPGTALFVPRGVEHELANVGVGALRLIEVQIGAPPQG